ncbi:MAG: hydantoinase B/oxoprolinase family protein [Thermoleophilia bacterium]
MPAPELDSVVLDLIENALKNARFEMDEVVRRAAMSPTIREQHDEFPMIANQRGQMVVGQFGSYIPEVIEQLGRLDEGDVILLNDPYICKGSVSHCNDWLVITPILHDGVLVGFASMFGHMMDVGGRVPGSQVADALSIWDEGIRIPPVKIAERGVVNDAALRVILNNTRTPEMNHSDLMALIAGCRTAERRVADLCDRFGRDTYLAACDALLERTRQGMVRLIRRYLPEEKAVFWDWVDDDGVGNGPLKLVLTAWRDGDRAVFDFTGTDPQTPGSVNFNLHPSLCKMLFGVYLIMAFDPAILFNEGYNEVFDVVLPEGSLLQPRFPAAVSNRLAVHVRFWDVQSGALGQCAPDLSMAAGYGTSPYLVYAGWDEDGEWFQLVELLFGGLPGRPADDGLDGHSWWPLFRSTPAEYMESYYPLVVERYEPVPDTGGPGLHRGGCGIEKQYLFRRAGTITINDDRAVHAPWGIGGGGAGGTSGKRLQRADGTVEELPSKIDNVVVAPGDRLVFRTAGAGGWGDPLERPAEKVERDVRRRLVSAAAARAGYGVVVGDDAATAALRAELRAARGARARFDFGDVPAGLVPPQ